MSHRPVLVAVWTCGVGLLLAAGCAADTESLDESSQDVAKRCGDRICNKHETCRSCRQDCGACPGSDGSAATGGSSGSGGNTGGTSGGGTGGAGGSGGTSATGGTG